MNEKAFETLAVIAARKGAYYYYVRDSLAALLKKGGMLPKTSEENKEIRHRLRQAIATLPNELFISPQEVSRFDKGLDLKQLNLNTSEIAKQLIDKLTS